MASTEERKIKIVADGSQVNATFNDMNAAAKLLQNQLKKLPPESEEFAKKSEKLKGIKTKMNDVKGSVFGVEKAQKGLNSEFMNMLPFGSQIQGIAGKFGQWTGVIKGTAGGFGTLGKAIIGTGLGALVVVLGLVINYLMNTQDGMDKVQRVLQPLNALFQRTIGVLQQLGGGVLSGLTKAINNPRKAFQEFVDFIKTNLMNRLKAVGVGFEALNMIMSGDVFAGAKKMGDAMIQATTGVTDGVDKMNNAFKETAEFIGDSIDIGKQMAELTIEIETAENKLLLKKAQLNAEYQKQKEIAQDTSKTEQERLTAAQKSQEAQNALLAEEQNLMKMKIELKGLENDLNDTSRADDKEYQQLLAQNVDFEAQAARKRASAKALENTVANQVHGERVKRLETEQKAEEENQKKITKLREEYGKASIESERALEDLRIAVMEEGTGKKIAKLELDTQRELAAMEDKKNIMLENEILTMEERQRVLDEWEESQALKKEEAEIAKQELLKEKQEAALEEDLSRLSEEEEMKALQLEEAYITAVDKEFEQKEKMLEIQRQYAAQKLALLEEAGKGETLQAQKLKNSILRIDTEIADGRIEQERRAEEMKRAIKQEGYAVAQDMLKLGIELLGHDEEARKKNAKAIKAFETGQVVIAGIKEVASIWKGAASLGPIAGPIMGAIQTGFAVARTAMAVNKIQGTKYADGGGTGSGKVVDMMFNGAAGSWQMPGGQKAKGVGTFAHGGHVNNASFGLIGEAGAEWVGPNWMMNSPKYANIFQYLETERVKGRAFAAGGTTAATPSAIPQNSGASADLQQTMQMLESFEEMKAIMADMRNLIQEWPTILRVINDPRDTRDALDVINQIESDSRITR